MASLQGKVTRGAGRRPGGCGMVRSHAAAGTP